MSEDRAMTKDELRERLIGYSLRGTRVGMRTRQEDGKPSVVVGYVTGITKGGSAMVQNCGQLVPVHLSQVLELVEVREPPGELPAQE